MKKIILYTSGQLKETPKTGGTKRFMELLNELPNLCELTLVSGDENYSVPKNANHLSMHQYEKYNKESKYAFHNYKYISQIKKMEYDKLIVFDVPPAIWLVLLGVPKICLMLRKDLIGYQKILLQESNKNLLYQFLLLKFLNLAEWLCIQKAENVIVQCSYDKNELLKRHYFTKKWNEKIQVQINNVNPSWANHTVKSTNDNDLSTFKVVSINDFSSTRKGCDIYLAAVAKLIENGYKLEAYIVGDGKLFDKYKQKYEKYENIIFTGRMEDVSGFMVDCSLAVVPSRADSCPNTVLEALNCGVPVIGSNQGGIPEILNDENALFESNADKLAEMIVKYMDKKNLDDLQQRQVARKEELTFDWSNRVYEKAINIGW